MQVQQLAEKSARAVTVDIFDDTAADSLIPNIRKAVSDCQKAVETTATNAQTATEQATLAQSAADSAATSETNTAARERAVRTGEQHDRWSAISTS